jgi:hypothetical protein
MVHFLQVCGVVSIALVIALAASLRHIPWDETMPLVARITEAITMSIILLLMSRRVDMRFILLGTLVAARLGMATAWTGV